MRIAFASGPIHNVRNCAFRAKNLRQAALCKSSRENRRKAEPGMHRVQQGSAPSSTSFVVPEQS